MGRGSADPPAHDTRRRAGGGVAQGKGNSGTVGKSNSSLASSHRLTLVPLPRAAISLPSARGRRLRGARTTPSSSEPSTCLDSLTTRAHVLPLPLHPRRASPCAPPLHVQARIAGGPERPFAKLPYYTLVPSSLCKYSSCSTLLALQALHVSTHILTWTTQPALPCMHEHTLTVHNPTHPACANIDPHSMPRGSTICAQRTPTRCIGDP